MTSFYVHIFASVLLFHFVVVNCLQTVTLETDGNLDVPSDSQFQRLWCNFTVSLRTALRVRWFNGRDIVAHYEENITDVGADYKSYVDTIGDLANNDSAISLNVARLHDLKPGVTEVTYKCLVHIYNGTSSQISFKNTTVHIRDPTTTTPESTTTATVINTTPDPAPESTTTGTVINTTSDPPTSTVAQSTSSYDPTSTYGGTVTGVDLTSPTSSTPIDNTSTTEKSTESLREQPDDGLTVGAIVGIVIGALVGVAVVIVLFVYFCVYHDRQTPLTGTATVNLDSVTLNSVIINLNLSKGLVKELMPGGDKCVIKAETKYLQGTDTNSVLMQSSDLAQGRISYGSCTVCLVDLIPATPYSVQNVSLYAGSSVYDCAMVNVNTFTTKNGQPKSSGGKNDMPFSLLNAVPKGRQLPPLNNRHTQKAVQEQKF